jgi:hypothetical protein
MAGRKPIGLACPNTMRYAYPVIIQGAALVEHLLDLTLLFWELMLHNLYSDGAKHRKVVRSDHSRKMLILNSQKDGQDKSDNEFHL